MRGQIAVGSGMKIRRAATIKDNTAVKSDLGVIKHAINQGLLDSIFTLRTIDRDDSGKIRHRNITITELDEQIKNTRKEKIQSIDFAIYQMGLFSKYLKKNVHASNGYSAGMVLNFIEIPELYKIIQLVLQQIKESQNTFEDGKYNNLQGQKETLLDHLVMKIHNTHHLQRLNDQR
jgi:hypothetical protein